MEIKKLTNQTDTQAQLTRELIEASQAYYGGGQSKYSDIEFDHAVEVLRALEESTGFRYEGSPTESVGAVVVSELKKVKHEQPALSLDKIKYADRDKLVEWLGDKEGIVSWKNDGLTVVVTYDNGKLIQAVTRGDGVEGSDITHNAVFFKGLPSKISCMGKVVVRGEAVMSNAEFERVNAAAGGVYENARNLASATIQMLDANESKKREIRFIAFELVTPKVQKVMFPRGDGKVLDMRFQEDRFSLLESFGFNVVKHALTDSKHILSVIEQWQEDMLKLDYPTDGLVISYNNMEYGMSLGATEHHYKHSIALKWNDETKETTIRDIEWSVGKTGVITPVAIFDEVRLGLGSNVTRASLHNLSIMEKLGVKMNSKAHAYLANMIIPQLTEVSGGDQEFEIPEVCPVCGEPTQLVCDNGVKTLHCGNSECAARQIGNLMNTFSKDGLFVKGLGESQIQDLMEYQLVNAYPVSFYNLARANYGDNDFEKRIQSLLNKDGWGKKKWQNLIDAIIESRETTLQKFLYSLNIPMLGNDLSKKLSKLWHNNIEEFLEFYKNPSFDTLNAIDGIGTEKANNVVDWCNNTRHDMLADLMLKTLIDELHFPAETETNNDSSLSGITFVITGAVHDYKNRDEFKASVEARGGKVAGSVSAKTNYLVNNDVNSTTGKNQKAKELGIEIISEDEFITRFGR